MLVGAKVHEQLVDRVEDLARTRVVAVDLVQGDHDRQATRHRLLQHVAGLRQRALGGIDEEEHRIDHEQRPLDLATEVGVTGRVDDVQPDVGVVDRRLLGEDRDALLALQVARVHDPIHERLVGAERAGLAQHRVHERGLAVIHVRDDRDVAQVVANTHRRGRGARGRGGLRRGGHGGAGDDLVGHGTGAVCHIDARYAPGRGHSRAC